MDAAATLAIVLVSALAGALAWQIISKLLKPQQPELNEEPDVRRLCVELRNAAAQLLDVREAHECQKGMLSGAVAYPLSAICSDDSIPPGLHKDRVTYVYCSDGRRARVAADALATLGFNSTCVALSRGFSYLCAAARNAKLDEADAALMRPVSSPAVVSKSHGRNMRSFDPETYQLFHALQTSRAYAEYEQVGRAIEHTPCDLSPLVVEAAALSRSQVRVLGRGTSASAVLLRAPPGLASHGDPLVVAKCFHVNSLVSDSELKHIENEVKLLKRLRHEHVIRCECTTAAHLHTLAHNTPKATGAPRVLPWETVAYSHCVASH